jgi:hypothetical protein
MADSVQKNFRMSQKSIRILHEVARALGVTETDVVETCVSKFALEIGRDVERAKELLFEQICRAAANSPVDAASMRRTTEAAATSNAQSRRAGSNIESAEPSVAGELASMVGEQWAGGAKKGKKK